MHRRWKRRSASKEEKQRIAYEVYQNRLLRSKSGDAQSDWQTAEKIAGTPIRLMLFLGNRPLIKLHNLFIAWDKPRWLLFSLPKLEWVKLLAVPLALGAAGSIITAQVQREANQNAVLKAYFDQLEELTFNQDLVAEEPQTGAIVLARGRTFAVLRELDLQRKTQILDFLQASGLSQLDNQDDNNTDDGSEVIEEPVISFKNQDFSDLDLRRVNLGGTDFRQAILADTNLAGADLRGANLEGADLRGARLEGADLWVANLKGADLREANLEGADLRVANLEGADLKVANLEGANLPGARLEGADLWRARLEGAYLREARLEGAALVEASLEGANLLEANLEGAYLWGANLEGANLWGANLEGANLSGARLEGADLWGARLEGADLREANLEGADLRGANLEGADLREANLEGADLLEANLEGAVLFRTRLNNVGDLKSAQISKAQLCETELPDYIDLDPNQHCKALKEQYPWEFE